MNLENNYLIAQTPQHVVLLAEMFHDVRVIPLDNRPRTNLAQWMGESRGRWEGDTLVVETGNFADKSKYWWATSWRAAIRRCASWNASGASISKPSITSSR